MSKVTKYFVMMVKISDEFDRRNKSSLSSTSSGLFGWDALKYDLVPRIPVRYRVRKILPVNSGTPRDHFP